MKYRLLGRTGLRVSELCLGCGTIGSQWGSIGCDRDTSFRILEGFAAAGGNFLDTSNRYQESESERWVGEFIQSERDYFVIGTKYSLGDGANDFNAARKGTNEADPNNRGNHRKNMRRSVEASLKRLQTDCIDVLWLHIWDYTTPFEEVILSVQDLIRAGKINYFGVSNVPAWQVARMNTYADIHGLNPIVAVQNEWSLVERSHEPEFLPMCKEIDLAVACWSPLGGGMVSGKYNQQPMDASISHRLIKHVNDPKTPWHATTQRNLGIMHEVLEVANRLGEPAAAIGLRWLIQQKNVVAIPVFSVKTEWQLLEALRAIQIRLSDAVMADLDTCSGAAISPPLQSFGAYPYPMLELGSPALPDFFSRGLLHGNTEGLISNHRVDRPYSYINDAN